METAYHTHILWDCIKHPEKARSRTIPPQLEEATKSYDQDQQPWAVQQALGDSASRQRDPRRVYALAGVRERPTAGTGNPTQSLGDAMCVLIVIGITGLLYTLLMAGLSAAFQRAQILNLGHVG
ncbi:hypothetical protein HPB50_005467 [Hyalomma asiaticum]|uniref:Uncharacterized protein n=1 Tax=Hyalomma asiaticum TaxID=266040 RepID=A0ACB7STM8_HYAAI|nr:hypothetical protein HPB50_005467 [Hyalomma asiaticum]